MRLTCGYQPIQGRISIGAGGLFGAGLEGGTQSQMNLLNVRESDFIFAHASGMFGFLGMIALFLALMIFLWRGLIVAEISRDHFGQCLAVCIVGTFFFQAFLNIGMNLGVMPVAGITLPFVSAGISSLWSSLIMVGHPPEHPHAPPAAGIPSPLAVAAWSGLRRWISRRQSRPAMPVIQLNSRAALLGLTPWARIERASASDVCQRPDSAHRLLPAPRGQTSPRGASLHSAGKPGAESPAPIPHAAS